MRIERAIWQNDEMQYSINILHAAEVHPGLILGSKLALGIFILDWLDRHQSGILGPRSRPSS